MEVFINKCSRFGWNPGYHKPDLTRPNMMFAPLKMARELMVESHKRASVWFENTQNRSTPIRCTMYQYFVSMLWPIARFNSDFVCVFFIRFECGNICFAFAYLLFRHILFHLSLSLFHAFFVTHFANFKNYSYILICSCNS